MKQHNFVAWNVFFGKVKNIKSSKQNEAQLNQANSENQKILREESMKNNKNWTKIINRMRVTNIK